MSEFKFITDERPAGRISNFLKSWKCITSDPAILHLVSGASLEFEEIPCQINKPVTKLNMKDHKAVDLEIETLSKKGVISVCEHEPNEFLSTIFLTPKKDGSFRLILNLKELNKSVTYHHFKMDTIQTCFNLMTPHCYMASLDLRDAYYSVPIHPQYQKYLKFKWKDVLYKFTALPNGLACAPRYFTKLLKPVFSHLREMGYISSGYLDDVFLVGRTFEECYKNVSASIDLLQQLGFIIHPEKSVTSPSHTLEHLGFILNSQTMTVSVNSAKIEKFNTYASYILRKENILIREAAVMSGIMVSCLPGVEFGDLFYRYLEVEKANALKMNGGNFDSKMSISLEARSDILWWIDNIGSSPKPLCRGKPDFILETDASTSGWGAKFGNNTTGGRWSVEEQRKHINTLELMAVKYSLHSLCSHIQNAHVLLQTDNTTTVAYIRNMGGTHSSVCNSVARDIWLWCKDRKIWLTVTHIPGIDNVDADKESRIFNDKTEWKLDSTILKSITEILGCPTIDLFASRLNAQFTRFVSWRPDPNAIAVDAFTYCWSNELNYIFPPFSLITRVLKKLSEDQAQAILIVPYWPTQPWFATMLHMMVLPPIILPKRKRLLQLPFNLESVHPLAHKMKLMACRLSGKDSEVHKFQQELQASYLHHGVQT